MLVLFCGGDQIFTSVVPSYRLDTAGSVDPKDDCLLYAGQVGNSGFGGVTCDVIIS
jgi:hypothetical protein